MPTMPTPPRRLWFQFGLRTMFVAVTIFAVLLGWQIRSVRLRAEFLRSVKSDRVVQGYSTCSVMSKSAAEDGFVYKPVILPWWRKILGDEPVEYFSLRQRSQEHEDRIRKLFPEAMILENVRDSSTGATRLIYKPERDRGQFIGESTSY
jgi:hypothetical protein